VAAEIAVLSFVTVDARTPTVKIPCAKFVVLTFLLTALVPLTYLGRL
jgi:hypothetical protein